MNDFFDQAFAYLIQDEGPTFTNDPNDSGGATKFGITKRFYQGFVGHEVDVSEIENMTEKTAKQFYLENYWTHLQCDKISRLSVAICIFDTAVLYGGGTAANLAQKASNICGIPLKVDGILGDMSVKALNEIDEGDFLREFHGLLMGRIDFVVQINPKDEVFRKGWTNRADRLLTLEQNATLNKSVT